MNIPPEMLDVVRTKTPQLIANKIVGVQPIPAAAELSKGLFTMVTIRNTWYRRTWRRIKSIPCKFSLHRMRFYHGYLEGWHMSCDSCGHFKELTDDEIQVERHKVYMWHALNRIKTIKKLDNPKTDIDAMEYIYHIMNDKIKAKDYGGIDDLIYLAIKKKISFTLCTTFLISTKDIRRELESRKDLVKYALKKSVNLPFKVVNNALIGIR